MKRQLWYAAAVALGLSVWGSAACGASPAASNNSSTASGTAATKSDSASAPNGQGATTPNPPSPANAASGAPAKTIYPLVTVSVNGKQLATQGILINGRTLLPIIDLVDNLGGKAMWDSQTKTAWAAFPRQKRTLRMVVGSADVKIYRYAPKDTHRIGSLIATTHLDQPPMLLGGYVVAPADAAANIVRAKVFYRADTKHVSIVSPSSHQTASR
jgi:Copper amine oxidase N-terminal domain